MPSRYTLSAEPARARMAVLGLTQAALAAACAIEVRTLQRWFAGQAVGRADAERIAAALGVGTAEVFGDMAHERTDVDAKVALVMRALGTRESAFAQGLRLIREHLGFVLQAISFAGHPTHGFVARHEVSPHFGSGFLVASIAAEAASLDLSVRMQLGRRLGYVGANLRARGATVSLAEVFSSRSMVAPRTEAGGFDLWIWIGPETREVILVANATFSVRCDTTRAPRVCDLDSAETTHALCVRPGPNQLRAAGLPNGFDRVTGDRAGRADVALDWWSAD
ncbi:MAG: hypothetical protein ABW252_09555 [Polyangiales bacterium]